MCHVRRFAPLYTRLWFICIAQWSDYHCFWYALSACVIKLPFWNFPNNLEVKRYIELNIVLLNVAPIPVYPKIMWHTGNLYLANKELNKILMDITRAWIKDNRKTKTDRNGMFKDWCLALNECFNALCELFTSYKPKDIRTMMAISDQ